ncbi:MAG: hypothetical protein N4A63_10440 [Vallitalea sp.]|jgi:hypothetical protein|nr:hypothetical protein [Vallitalea sp.]
MRKSTQENSEKIKKTIKNNGKYDANFNDQYIKKEYKAGDNKEHN